MGMDNNSDELYLVGDMPHADWLKENIGKYLSRAFAVNEAADFKQNEMAKRKDVPYDLKAMYL